MRNLLSYLLVIVALASCSSTTLSPLHETKFMTSIFQEARRYDTLLTLLQRELQKYGGDDELDPTEDLSEKLRTHDFEAQLYILDDLAEIYAHGLVDFERAFETNSKALQRYNAIQRTGLDNLPLSPFFNSRRNLYFFLYPSEAKARLVPGYGVSATQNTDPSLTGQARKVFEKVDFGFGLSSGRELALALRVTHESSQRSPRDPPSCCQPDEEPELIHFSFTNPTGVVRYVTPYPKSTLDFVRRDDLLQAKARIDERFAFLANKVKGEHPPEPVRRPRPELPTLDEPQQFLEILRALGVHNDYYTHQVLAARAWALYSNDDSDQNRQHLMTFASRALAAEPTNRLEGEFKSLMQLHFWLGVTSLKAGLDELGIRHMEQFKDAIDQDEKEVIARFSRLEQNRREAAEKRKTREERVRKIVAGTIVALGIAASLYVDIASAASYRTNFTSDILRLFDSGPDGISPWQRLVTGDPLPSDYGYLQSAYGVGFNRFFSKYEQEELFVDLARSYESQGKRETAIELYKQAASIVDTHRQSISTEVDRIRFLSQSERSYKHLIPLLLRERKFDEAFEYIERSRSRAFVELLGSRGLVLRTREETDTYSKILQKRSEVDAILDQRGLGTLQIRTAVDKMRDLYVGRPAPTESIEFRSLSTVQTASVKDVATALGNDAALVTYYLADDSLSILVLQDGEVTGSIAEIDRRRLLEATADFRFRIEQALTAPATESDTSQPSDIERLGQNLFNLLWRPVADRINKPVVYIVPHGPLHYLPFAALNDDGHYLVERHAFAVVPSATVLTFLNNKQKAGSDTALIVANPEIGHENLSLPHADKEGQAVARRVSGARLLARGAATETQVKSLAPTAGIIHFATHGIFNFQKPLESGLLLTPDRRNDGILTAREIFSLTLPGSLVVLSACQTGVNRIAPGDELIGLARALMYAGATTILASLWNVNDESTAELMREFYERLKTNSKAVALQGAQVALKKRYRQPFHWAAFQLIGDYR